MNRIQYVSLVLLATLLGGMHPASALSTESGNATPGSYMNLADPDEQVPGFLKSPEDQAASGNSNHFDSDNGQPVIVHRNILRQSPAMPFNSNDQSDSQR